MLTFTYIAPSRFSYKQSLREKLLKEGIFKQKSFPQFFALFSYSVSHWSMKLAIDWWSRIPRDLFQLLWLLSSPIVNVNDDVCFKCLNVFFCSFDTHCLCIGDVLLSIYWFYHFRFIEKASLVCSALIASTISTFAFGQFAELNLGHSFILSL